MTRGLVMVSAPAGSGERPGRVALVAERRLVGQAVAAALRSKLLAPVVFEWPRRRVRAFHQEVIRGRMTVGLILCDLETPDLLRDVESLVAWRRVRWLVLTDSRLGPRWGTVLEAGALGVLPTTTSTEALATAVRETLNGGSPMPLRLRDQAIQEWHDVADEQRDLVRRMEQLTHREFQVLAGLYDGTSVRRIAEMSGVSEATVRSQVKSLRRKLEVDSQLAAVATYRRALEVFPRAQP